MLILFGFFFFLILFIGPKKSQKKMINWQYINGFFEHTCYTSPINKINKRHEYYCIYTYIEFTKLVFLF